MGKKKDKVDSNGSFLVKTGGVINYIGTKSDDENQVVTFNNESNELESTDASLLFDDIYCVSQYEDSAPGERPNGDELLEGDLWTSSIDKNFYVWSEDEVWIPASTPTGTIIQSVAPAPPTGYLLCDGSTCPPQYEVLRSMLIAPDFFLPGSPLIPPIDPPIEEPVIATIYSYIKF